MPRPKQNLEAHVAESVLSAAKSYVSKLDLKGYSISYSAPRVANWRRIDSSKPHGEGNATPGEYQIQVAVRDKDKTEVYFRLFLDSQTFKGRAEPVWNPKSDQIAAAIRGKRQHYVLLMVGTEAEARRIYDESLKNGSVVSATYGDKSLVRQMEANAVLAWAHGARKQKGPKAARVKPDEKARKSLVEKCQVLSENSELSD